MNDILITYFEPFGNRTTNASKEIAMSFKNIYEIKELPVSWKKAKEEIEKLEVSHYLFMIGEAGSYQNIKVELEAHNISNGVDNDSISKNNEIIDEKGDTLKTNIDFTNFDKCELSTDAGNYLCNYSYYLALKYFKEKSKVVFIHVPYIDEKNDIKTSENKIKEIIKYVVNKDIKICYFNKLNKDVKKIRKDVFVKEQGFINEFDDIDNISIHFVAYINNSSIATCRLFFDEENKTYHFGRLAVLPTYRNLGIGSLLIKTAEEYAIEKECRKIILGAQIKAKSFYKKCGYQEYGDIFLDEDTPHIMMKKIL